MERTALDFFALGMLIFVGITLLYAIIYIHDIPYEIAKKRNHPHQDAIHTAGWVSLFLMHAIWPFLWIWATMYKPEIGWGMDNISENKEKEKQQSIPFQKKEIDALQSKVAALEAQFKQLSVKA
ncbi:MAG: DUF3302 domain-containing protein [Thermodesulfobacteriota bacterium]|nr:DUF3302 domain-containing protein [Thermodesulfobacteriota bacterium]